MTPFVIGLIGIGILLLALFSGLSIGVCMMLIGFLGMGCISGWGPALGLLKTVPYSTITDYGLSVIPLFVLMGQFCFFAGMTKDLYETFHSWLGHMRGGLAMATVGACAGFAAVSGSAIATAATMATVTLPEMKRYKYDPALATGCVAAGGSIGIMIPPSVIFIVYGIITEQSIGKLFLAGFIPGVLEALFYMAVIYVLCKRNPVIGPPGPKTSFRHKIATLKNTWIVLVLFLVVIGGIYLGVFSPTEAAGVGAFGAFIFALCRRRLSLEAFKLSLVETVKTSAMIFVIIIGAMILGYFLAVTRIPFELAGFITGLQVNRYITLGLILLIYLFLGCIMDALAMILLTVPIFFPLVMALGFDPIWFGVIIIRVFEIGIITPPVGMNVFVIKGVAPDIPLDTIFKGIIPFLIADVCLVALLIAVPQLSLYLPSFMK